MTIEILIGFAHTSRNERRYHGPVLFSVALRFALFLSHKSESESDGELCPHFHCRVRRSSTLTSAFLQAQPQQGYPMNKCILNPAAFLARSHVNGFNGAFFFWLRLVILDQQCTRVVPPACDIEVRLALHVPSHNCR